MCRCAPCTAAFAEGMSLADKAGLKQEDLLDVLGLGAMANPMFGEQHAAQLQLVLHVRACNSHCGLAPVAGVSWRCCGGCCCRLLFSRE